MKPDTLGVIGLGAVGGSVAWQASLAGVKRVIGHSPVPKEGVAALKVGAVTEVEADIERVMRVSDLTVLALPPTVTLDILDQLAEVVLDRPGYSTDVASVKGPIVEKAGSLGLERHFAGGHPLAGSPYSGFAAARPDTFTGKVVYITPLENGDVAAAEVADFWKRVIGAEPVILGADAHDATLAWTSHLPQLATSILAATIARKGPKGVTYGRGATKATERAIGNVEMWKQIALMNKHEVLTALDVLMSETGRLVAAVESGDEERIQDVLEAGCQWREKLEP